MRIWAIAIAGVIFVFGLATIFGERMVSATGWVMVAVLWLVFVALIATVVARRRRGGETR